MLQRRHLLAGFAAIATGAAGPGDGDLVGGPPDAASGSLPFTVEGLALQIDISVNGAPPAPFRVDTGATLTAIDAVFAATHGLQPSGGGRVRGVNGGSAPQELLQDLALRGGGVDFPAQIAGLLHFPNHIVDRGNRPRLAGLIGLNAFGPVMIRIDLRTQRLVLLPPDAPISPDAVILPLSTAVHFGGFSAGSPAWSHATVAADLDGTKLRLLLDTGFGGNVLLSDACIQANDLWSRYERHIDIVSPGGIDGSTRASLALASSLALGPAMIAAPIIALSREPVPYQQPRDYRGRFGDRGARSQPSAAPFDGLLGLSGLLHFVPTIDLPGQRLILEPRLHKAEPGPRFWRTNGLCLDKPVHDRFTVLSTVAGTPAAQLGIAAGDEIIGVNGIAATDLALFDLGLQEATGPVTFRFASGRSQTLAAVALPL